MADPRVEAITFDFYLTLAYSRAGRGRGAVFMDYLREHGFESDPWEHQVLYDVFERHAIEYDPAAPADERKRYYRLFAERVFRRMNVRLVERSDRSLAGSRDDVAGAAVAGSDPAAQPAVRHAVRHAADIWKIFGPQCLALFPDVLETLTALRGAGYPLALVSNWQSGLHHFCVEMGLGEAFDHVLSSADVGYEKPDPRIFEDACRRLGCPPARVLHVGDSPLDVDGGLAAGLQVVRMERIVEARAEAQEPDSPPLADTVTIRGLSELSRLLDSKGTVS